VNLADRLAGTSVGLSGAICTVCRLLVELGEPDRSTLEDALTGDGYTSKQIAAALVAEGHRVSSGTVSRHRRRECRGVA
jgi:hypothetical protein